MTNKHITSSKLLALQRYDIGYENDDGGMSVHTSSTGEFVSFDDLRALIDEAPEVESVGKVVNIKKEFPHAVTYGHMFIDLPDQTKLYTSPPDLTKLVGELVEALEELEWDGWEYDKGGEGFAKCPSCGNAQHGTNCHHAGEIGHKNDCSLNNALTRAKEYLK